jgi:hypothetical protein
MEGKRMGHWIFVQLFKIKLESRCHTLLDVGTPCWITLLEKYFSHEAVVIVTEVERLQNMLGILEDGHKFGQWLVRVCVFHWASF